RQLPAPRRAARRAQAREEAGKSKEEKAMMTTKPLKVEAVGDLEILMERAFDAPRQLVFDAHTKPELVKRWLLGPDGWSMPVCEIDLRVGGPYRYVWRRDVDGVEMGRGGFILGVVPPRGL